MQLTRPCALWVRTSAEAGVVPTRGLDCLLQPPPLGVAADKGRRHSSCDGGITAMHRMGAEEGPALPIWVGVSQASKEWFGPSGFCRALGDGPPSPKGCIAAVCSAARAYRFELELG